jgi:hypothetical protein
LLEFMPVAPLLAAGAPPAPLVVGGETHWPALHIAPATHSAALVHEPEPSPDVAPQATTPSKPDTNPSTDTGRKSKGIF